MGFQADYGKYASRGLSIIFRFGPKFKMGKNLGRFLLNYVDPYLYIDRWSTQPFNGQNSRYRQLVLISEFFKPSVAIETGTYLGTSTPALAGLVSERTFTIEFVKRLALKSNQRFKLKFEKLNIKVIQGDSAKLIREILQELDPTRVKILAYLDAHWEKVIPTNKELLELAAWGGQWVAVIDDFKVPGDDSYGFDRYGNLAVDKSIIPSIEGIQILVPKSPADKETGAKKGTAYVFSPSFGNLDLEVEFPELRRITVQ